MCLAGAGLRAPQVCSVLAKIRQVRPELVGGLAIAR